MQRAIASDETQTVPTLRISRPCPCVPCFNAVALRRAQWALVKRCKVQGGKSKSTRFRGMFPDGLSRKTIKNCVGTLF